MNRRQFIQTMGALAAAAVIPTVAEAAITAVPAVDPNAKYREAMRLFDRCVPYAQDSAECTRRFNELLGYLKENFVVPEINDQTREATDKVLHGGYSISELRSISPVVADAVYPIALAKLGLYHYRLAPNPQRMENFDWFHKSYGKLIVAAAVDIK